MKYLFLILLCVSFGAFGKDLFPKKYEKMRHGRRYCVGRDCTTLKGYVITKWHRDGKPDWILPSEVTNKLQNITGVRQMNPLEAEAKKTRDFKKKSKRATKSLRKIIKTIEQARKKANTDEEVELYNALLSFITEESE